MFFKEIFIIGSVLCVFMFLSGCATRSDLEEVRVIADSANAAATSSLIASGEAKACCENVNEKVDRMYQRIMGK